MINLTLSFIKTWFLTSSTNENGEKKISLTFLERNMAASIVPSAYIERPQTLCWNSKETLIKASEENLDKTEADLELSFSETNCSDVCLRFIRWSEMVLMECMTFKMFFRNTHHLKLFLRVSDHFYLSIRVKSSL